ncbi:MAG: FAD binding domain-containing protein [Chloroflexi bacterium]|nr:FAD binding domain-containing protein [Chloroflexota bacterium]
MKLWNNYHTPHSIDEALTLLNQYQGKARVVAGGTDLMVELREGHRPVQDALIDITMIPELTTLAPTDDEIYIGAGVTHTQLVKSPLLAALATCLVESCGVVGGPQVRNVGTLGGNVAHALPAGDGTTSLVALDAQADIVMDGQRRVVPILEMYRGPGQSLIDSTHDLIIGFRFALCAEREATAFKRIMRPQGVALPILGCATWVRLNPAKTHFEATRLSIAPIGPTPARATEVEAVLTGQPANDATIESAIDTAVKILKPRTSKYRATGEYRREMIAVLLRRTLQLAVQRAQTGQAVPEGIGIE